MFKGNEIEAIARHVYKATREWDGVSVANLLIRLMDCFDDDKEWLSAVRDYATEKLEELE